MSATATSYDPIRTLLETATQQIERNELREAALTLNECQRLWPNDARVFMLAGLMAERSGNIPAAFDALRRCVAADPNWTPGELQLALLYSRRGMYDKAIKHAERLARREPNNALVLAHLVDFAHEAGNTELAIRELRRGLEYMPRDAQLRRVLANDLQVTGQRAEAVEVWGSLIADNPKDEMALLGRATTLIEAGKPSAATSDTTKLLELSPGNSIYAYFNAIAHGLTPDHQPPELNRMLFDTLASSYDQRVVRGLHYQLPKIVAEKIVARFPTKSLSILDLGCGTGLLGACLGRIDGFLIGVDISTKMIEQAARHEVYDRFHTVNMLDALRETPGEIYEVITALDVFIYTGDLKATVPDAHRILLPAGDLYFSCETAPEDGPDFVLQSTGRYAHKRSYVQALCKQVGFEDVQIEDMVLRNEGDEPVNGFLVTARKAA
ncbi:tetratricopeptide repeat protein [Diaphorobacter aerolatus]|uniref:Tetratricopeptide repeat protein n=1 Tax=Diaphorobacter aerolatus TaxID=1288495 RepID=A0A7H0GNC4_9BURK|nr:tetratricopeptide repeat protein [Diaphorobacter aerolatus]QNP49790.1 tetratricopeptide repeat protein [Diaphorobacter aerolatus]